MKYGQKKSSKTLPRLVFLVCCILAGFLAVSTVNLLDNNEQGAESEESVTELKEGFESGGVSGQFLNSSVGRKAIYDRHMEVLAQSIGVASVYIRPLELRDRHVTIVKLADLLGLENEKLFAELRTERSFIWLKHDISAQKAQSIKELDLDGVYLVNEGQRYYPFKNHASHMVGFAEKEHGLAGAEFIYDSLLRGEKLSNENHLRLIPEAERKNLGDGASLILSIDIDLQILLEAKLELLLKKVDGDTGSAVLMDAKSGEIYAMANKPDFDPNKFWKADNYDRKNRAADEQIKLGGLRDLFLVAAEIDSGNRFIIENVDTLEVASRIIEPRQIKKIKGAFYSGKSDWEKWGEDGYVAPLMKWPNGFKAKPRKLVDICEEIGLGKTNYLSDLSDQSGFGKKVVSQKCDLENPDFTVTLAGLTNGFSLLVNGGIGVEPQILHRLWLDNEKRMIELNAPKGEPSLDSNDSVNFVDFLKSLHAPDQRDLLFVESLSGHEKISEDIGLQEEDSATKTKKERTPEKSSSELRANTILLAAETKGERQLVLGLAVDGAVVDTRKMSPFQAIGREIISKGRKVLLKNMKNSADKPKQLSYQDSFDRWREEKIVKSPMGASPSKHEKQDRMPKLVGLSLRKAFQDINELNLMVSVNGAGRIIGQSIKPGEKLQSGQHLTLELAIDH